VEDWTGGSGRAAARSAGALSVDGVQAGARGDRGSTRRERGSCGVVPRRSPCRSGRPRLRRGPPSSSRTAALGRPVAFIALRSPVRGSSRARRRPARTRPQPSILAAWFRASRSSAPTRSAVRRWWSSRLRWARRGRRQGNLLLSGSLRSEKGKGSSRPGSPSAIPSTPMIRRSPSRGARRAGRRTRFPASSKPDAAAVAFALVGGDSELDLGRGAQLPHHERE